MKYINPPVVIAGILASVGALAGCGGAAPAPKANAPSAPQVTGATEGPFKVGATLQWMPDGEWLLVDGHLRFEPATGKFSPVNGTRAGERPILGPTGERAYVDAKSVRVPGGSVAIPVWLEGAPEVYGAAGYWLDAERIYVQQFTDSAAACRVLDVASKAWKLPAAECLDPGQWTVESLVPGPGFLVHAYTTNDGAPTVQLLRYDPRQGQGETLVGLNAKAAELPTVTFTPDGVHARVVTTCTQPTGACGQAPTLVELDLFDKKTVVVGPVAAGAVPSPTDAQLAWIHNGALCLGAQGGDVRCFAP